MPKSVPPVKIGLIHSLTGTMALSERPLMEAGSLAIEEINRTGGVLGHRVEPIVVDGGSVSELFAQKARELVQAGVSSLFGCWTSAARKAVKPLVESSGRLLWYPVQYEGFEESHNIIYTGCCLNQQIVPATEWALSNLGSRVYLLGSDYVFPRTSTRLVRSLIEHHGGQAVAVAEQYVPFGEQEFAPVIGEIQRLQPDWIFNSLNGDSNLAFFRQFHAAGLEAKRTSILSVSMAETELAPLGTIAAGHLACWNYFQTLDNPKNRRFVAAFQKRYGPGRPCSASMVMAYSQIYLWKQAVEAAGSFEAAAIMEAVKGLSFNGPSGRVTMQPNHHLTATAYIGQAKPDGQFEIVWASPQPIPPLPWLGIEESKLPNKELIQESMASSSDALHYSKLLEQEAAERQRVSEALRQANELLDKRVGERTEALQASEARFRDLVENISDWIWETDARLRYVYVSPKVTELLGYNPAEVIGKTPFELMVPIEATRLQSVWVELKRRPRPFRAQEILNVHKDGSLRVLETSGVPIYDGSGRFTGYRGIDRDITERRRVEEKLRRHQEELEELVKERTAALSEANETLTNEIVEHRRSEIQLRKLTTAIEQSSVSVVITDCEGRIEYVNPAFTQLTGYSAEEAMGQNPRVLKSGTMPPEIYTQLWRTVVAGRAWHGELCNRKKNGELYWESAAIAPIIDANGDITNFVAVKEDITTRKRAEEARRQSEEKFRLLLDSTAEAIYGIDLNGDCTFCNSACLRMLGYIHPEQLLGNNMHRQIHHSHADGSAFPFEESRTYQTLHEGAGAHVDDKVIWRQDGSCFSAEYWCYPQRRDGKVVGAVVTFMDVTERKQMIAELAAVRDAALASARAKAEFLANMSHEIRTPMNGVIGMTNLLMDTNLTAEQREFAQTIHHSGESLLTIINDILDFSKIEARKLVFETLDFDLREAVEDVLALVAERAREKSIELAGFVPGTVPTLLRGDPGRVRQVLTNLVGNAIKFTERGDVIVRVATMEETPAQVWLRFEVQDSGIGISPAAQARLFQAFQQADGSTTRKYGGTGLGLAISKQLVEMMQGQIGVTSEPGKGSIFWFTLQLEKQSAGAVLPVVRGTLVNLRALIVDDNATSRLILEHQLKGWGMFSHSIASSVKALAALHEALTTDPYDLVILDMQMPEMDGLALAKAIKADPLLTKIRLVMLTSLGQPRDSAELKAAGIEACLVKPVKQARLFDCLTAVMGQTVAHVVPPPAPAHRPMRKLRVLLAEDNVVNQKVALGQLRKLGYAADAVANGLEVLEALKQIPYDAILMDCQMPEMDGYEASREIRRHEPLQGQKRVFIVAMTANAMQGDREKCLEAGMDDYVAKPVREADLQRVLSRCEQLHGDPSDLAAGTGGESLPESARPQGESHLPPVDMARLKMISGDDPALMCEFVNLYLPQADEILKGLEVAIKAGLTHEVHRLAHKLFGSSANIGVQSILPCLRELERQGKGGELAEAELLWAQAGRQLELTRQFLYQQLPGWTGNRPDGAS